MHRFCGFRTIRRGRWPTSRAPSYWRVDLGRVAGETLTGTGHADLMLSGPGGDVVTGTRRARRHLRRHRRRSPIRRERP